MSSHGRVSGSAVLASVCLMIGAAPCVAAATYRFNNTLAAEEAGAPLLVSVDPLNANDFETATVFGQQRPVFKWDGNASPVNEQAGLTLNTSGLVAPTSYTLELVFE